MISRYWLVLSVLCGIAAGGTISSKGNMTLSLRAIPKTNGTDGLTNGDSWTKELITQTRICSATNVCNVGWHCCTTTTCCPDNNFCCGGGLYCCQYSGSSSVKAILGLTATALFLQVGRSFW